MALAAAEKREDNLAESQVNKFPYDTAWSIVFKNGNFTQEEFASTGKRGLPTSGTITAVGVGLGVFYGADGTGAYIRVRVQEGQIKPLYYVKVNNEWYYYNVDGGMWVLSPEPLLFKRGDVGKDLDCGEENWDRRTRESAEQSADAYYSALLNIEQMKGIDFDSYLGMVVATKTWAEEEMKEAEKLQKEQYKQLSEYLDDIYKKISGIQNKWGKDAVLVPAAISYRVIKGGKETALVVGTVLVKNKRTGQFYLPELDLIGDLDTIAIECARNSGSYARIIIPGAKSEEYYSPPKEVLWEIVGAITGMRDIEEFIHNPGFRTAIPAAITIVQWALLAAGAAGVGRVATAGTRAAWSLEAIGLRGGVGFWGGASRIGRIIAFNTIALQPLKKAPENPLPAIAESIFGIALWYCAYELAIGKLLVKAPKWIKRVGTPSVFGGAIAIDMTVGGVLDRMIESKELTPEYLKETINGVILDLENGEALGLEKADYIALQGLLEINILAYIYCKLKSGEGLSDEEIEWINRQISSAKDILSERGITTGPLVELSAALEKMGFDYNMSSVPKRRE